jgi:hypothetical protein
MKTVIAILSAALLCGCGQQKSDPKIAELELRVAMLETNLANLNTFANDINRVQDADYGVLTNEITELDSRITDMQLASLPKLDPATGLPYGADPKKYDGKIDPETGLPELKKSQPKVFGIVGKVTEANDQWWRWAIQFSIGNPSGMALDTDADIQFLDTQGFVVETKHEYHLKVDAYSTNHFSNYQFVDLPDAANVKKLNVILEQ